jgi:hypothetical protein
MIGSLVTPFAAINGFWGLSWNWGDDLSASPIGTVGMLLSFIGIITCIIDVSRQLIPYLSLDRGSG